VQDTPCWVTVTAWPATVSVPVRDVVPASAATVNAKAPDPVADVPPVAVIQAAPELAVQAHVLPVVTLTDPVPPAAPIVIEVVERV
jgi:hypothetical protein